jgi:DNA-directed RNA polymerase subunit RPC12/RpoP
MARETIRCPHCECKVLLSEVEKEDGLCPECSQLVLSSNLFDDYDDEEDLELDEIEDEDFDDEEDDFDDEDDFEDDPAIHRQQIYRKRKRNFE